MTVAIVGGGLAGAAAAAGLAQAGVEVTVFERERDPVNKICGEFLSTEAQAYLARLGFDVTGLGGQPIAALRLVRGRHVVETRLPFEGIGLSRLVLDAALLSHAQVQGAVVRRGVAVRRVDVADGISLALTGDMAADTLAVRTVFLASGKHEVRGARRQVQTPEDLVGLKMYYRLGQAEAAALAGHVALILFDGGYAGLQMVEGGQANLCLLVDRGRLSQAGGALETLLEALCRKTPYLAGMMRGAAPLLAQPLGIYRVPYGYMHRGRPDAPPGIFRLGDQAAVIPSFTGDGMAMALHGAALAVAVYAGGGDAAAYHRRLAADLGAQMRRAQGLYRLASRPSTQGLFFRAARAWPGSLGLAARLTRVPAAARL